MNLSSHDSIENTTTKNTLRLLNNGLVGDIYYYLLSSSTSLKIGYYVSEIENTAIF